MYLHTQYRLRWLLLPLIWSSCTAQAVQIGTEVTLWVESGLGRGAVHSQLSSQREIPLGTRKSWRGSGANEINGMVVISLVELLGFSSRALTWSKKK